MGNKPRSWLEPSQCLEPAPARIQFKLIQVIKKLIYTGVPPLVKKRAAFEFTASNEGEVTVNKLIYDTAGGKGGVSDAGPVQIAKVPKAKVIYDYQSSTDTDVTVSEGEIVDISPDDQNDQDWAFVTKTNGEQGYVPRTYIEFLD
ncbi:MAG: hypothetical protein EZS28_017824 [Streblomastix strix]|uniref:SH3 domain-containing protein n=1 Tax=Streblomastix strix TaxID=222440 RepID=A0A5J4VWJ6_9EUKA|nr:MAG: hypothetical protein EZS28_017824 [Streblomastix strix]